MPRSGTAHLPLHGGKAPAWLFKRMVALSREIVTVLVEEYGTEEVLRRMSDPFWFQAFSCVLGFDWHSSGTTTVTCAALKEALDPASLGLACIGGKGKASTGTLEEIATVGELFSLSSASVEQLRYCSRMAAKVDNAAVQDGHHLYHHTFLLTEKGRWAVVQQGLNPTTRYARRYHWLSEAVSNFTVEPHASIVGDDRLDRVLDMTANDSVASQKVAVDLVNEDPSHLRHEWAQLALRPSQQTLDRWAGDGMPSFPHLQMPRTIDWGKMKALYDVHPTNYEELLSLRGVGPSTVRALALVAEVVYGEPPSWKDPVRFSFAVGGKDGVPYPVDRQAMDEATAQLAAGIQQARLGHKEQLQALRRLRNFLPSA